MKKKLIIPLLTLTIILCGSLAAYALTMTSSSTIITGTVTMTAKSTTSTNESCAQTVSNSFYQDGEFRDSSGNYILSGYSVSCSSFAFNLPGNQFWECVGHHHADTLDKETYASRYW